MDAVVTLSSTVVLGYTPPKADPDQGMPEQMSHSGGTPRRNRERCRKWKGKELVLRRGAQAVSHPSGVSLLPGGRELGSHIPAPTGQSGTPLWENDPLAPGKSSEVTGTGLMPEVVTAISGWWSSEPENEKPAWQGQQRGRNKPRSAMTLWSSWSSVSHHPPPDALLYRQDTALIGFNHC